MPIPIERMSIPVERISVCNLLSFGEPAEPLDLRPLNVLIGINGSGKSNLIETIGLLASMPARDVRIHRPKWRYLALALEGLGCSPHRKDRRLG